MLGSVLTFKFHNFFTDIKMLVRSLTLIALSVIDIIISLLFFWRIDGGFVFRLANARSILVMESVADLRRQSEQVSVLDAKLQKKLESLRP